MILKMGLIRVYAKVNWDFLRLFPIHTGMDLKASNQIMGCILSTNFVVLLNDTPFFSHVLEACANVVPYPPFYFF